MPGVETDSGAEPIDAEVHVDVQHVHVVCRFRLENAEAGLVARDVGGVQVAQHCARLASVLTNSRRRCDGCGELVEIGHWEVPLDQEQADGTAGTSHTADSDSSSVNAHPGNYATMARECAFSPAGPANAHRVYGRS